MNPTGTIVWDKRTLKGLAHLEELLREIGSLNTGNYHLERTARIVLAEELGRMDLTGRRPSFKAVLVQSANEAVIGAAGGPGEAKPT
jgi:hypothetical protein